MHALVDIEHVSLFLPGDASHTLVLHDIVWTVERGAHCALLGPNGSGKSTLLRLLRGELWPAQGHIRWLGMDGPEESPLTGRGLTALVSPLQQETYQRQAWDLSGRDLLLTGFEDTPLLYSQADAALEDTVETMARSLHIEGLLERRLPTFSQGQLRLLLLGRALLRKPALLLLDEYDDGLDTRYQHIFFDILATYADHCTVIMSAHRPASIPHWCAGRRYMREGRLFSAPPVTSAQSQAPAVAPKQYITPRRHEDDGSPLLELENVCVYIDHTKVLHNITWSLHRGENWRITGANGSGKSTLLRLLAGDEFVADGGHITRILPSEGGTVVTLDAVRRGIRVVADLSQALYGYDLNALHMVCTGFDNSIGVYRQFSNTEFAEARAAIKLLFPEMEPPALLHLEKQSIRRLSSGQLRRLFLARALMGQPDILLLDEPCSGLDASAHFGYLHLLDILAERDIQIILVSHHDDDAPLCINREAQMENGRLRIVH